MNSRELRGREQKAAALAASIRKSIKRLPAHLRPEPTLLTYKQAAEECGRTELEIRSLVRRRFLPLVTLDGETLIPRSTLAAHVRR